MSALEVVFWACVLLVVHTYLLYPVFLFGASSAVQVWRDWHYLRSRQDRRPRAADSVALPSVSLIIPAHNEAQQLPDKLANLRALDYPKEDLDIVFVSDGSTDGTNALLRSVEGGNVQVIYLATRGGKASALNQAVGRARHDLLVFSDAATLLAPDAVTKLVRHFSDPRIGVVCGALEFQASAESRQTEGVYWRYESMLRLMEARLGITLTSSGALYAVRRQCFVPLSADTLVEDLIVPMNARKLGFRVRYDPEASATDFAPPTVADEFARRVRIATGSFQALRHLVGVPLDPLTAFALLSHKVLRWILPFLLMGLLASSATLWEQPLYRAALIGQLLFYAWAGLGFLCRRQLQRIPYGLIAYYLLAIHLAFLVGFFRVAMGRTEGTWRRVN